MNPIKAALAYKITILFVSFFVVVNLCSSISLALEHGSLKDFTLEDWILLVCGILVNFGNTMMAYMQQHLKNYLNEYLGDATVHTEKTEITKTTTDKPSPDPTQPPKT